MEKKIDRVKAHVKKYKLHYAVGATAVVSVGVTVLICKMKSPKIIETAIQNTNTNVQILSWKPETNQMIINLIERSTPSKPVHLEGTNLFFASLNEAARETGHSLSQISKNVSGKIPNVNGDVFTLLEKAA